MMKIEIKQALSVPTPETVDGLSQVLVLVDEAGPAKDWSDIPYGELLRTRRGRRPETAEGPLIADLPNAAGTRVVLEAVKAGASAFERLTQARKLAAAALAEGPARIDLVLAGLPGPLADAWAGAAVAALLAAAHVPFTRKRKPAAPRPLQTLQVWGTDRLDLARLRAEAEANNLARDLTLRPPNLLTPQRYRESVETLAREHGWSLHFYDEEALARLEAGAFLAVAQGSAERDAGIVHLRYAPAGGPAGPGVALVGKGICFDTGGNNLKPARGMFGMHGDMQGSAVALATLLALTRLEVPFAVDCWLALAQNRIGPAAYRQNDVVTACNGTTIEVVHTDAEGRMVLADTLALAGREAPGLIIDYATLTGACIYALGTRYSGAFTNRETLLAEIIGAGRDSGERVWPFPNEADYDEELESALADVKQCILDGEADHILAARFLNRFVPETIPWIHVDLAAGEHKGGLAHVPTDVTGFGIRFTLGLLLDRKLLSRSFE